jgi:hypothetical protein
MGKVDFILQGWEVIGSIAGAILSLVVWLLRLEGKGNANAKDVEHLYSRMETQEKAYLMFKDKVTEELGDIKTMLARILAKMEDK